MKFSEWLAVAGWALVVGAAFGASVAGTHGAIERLFPIPKTAEHLDITVINPSGAFPPEHRPNDGDKPDRGEFGKDGS